MARVDAVTGADRAGGRPAQLARRRQLLQGLQPERAQELEGRPVEDGPPDRVQPPHLLHQPPATRLPSTPSAFTPRRASICARVTGWR